MTDSINVNSTGVNDITKIVTKKTEAEEKESSKNESAEFVETTKDPNATTTNDGIFEGVSFSSDSANTTTTDTSTSATTTDGTAATTTTDGTAATTTTDSTASTTEQEKSALAKMVDGFKDVDTSNLTGKNVTELNELQTTLESNLKLLNDELEALEARKTQIETQLNALMAAAQAALDAANETLEKEKTNVDNEQAKLDELTTKFDEQQKNLEALNAQIMAEQENVKAQFEDTIKNITASAIASYDPEKDGDFDSYLNTRLNSAGYVSYTKLDSLNAESKELADVANGLLSQIKGQTSVLQIAKSTYDGAVQAVADAKSQVENAKSNELASVNADIDTIKAGITTTTSQLESVKALTKTNCAGSGYTGAQILAMVSQGEKDLAKNNNIDLKTCQFAMGEDEKWHIYNANGESLARLYGEDGVGCLPGSDLVPMGSGYMYCKNAADEGNMEQARAIYTFTSINEDMTDGEATWDAFNYHTASPLSFDVDGDGVNTSAEMMSYDIDGDGTADRINNSAEWVLAFDKDHNGIAGENGSELFGDNTDLDGDGVKDGYANGFEALKALAKKEGLISDDDMKLDAADLKFLGEKYGLVMTKGYGGEAASLESLGITEINLSKTDDTKLTKNFDGRHNDIMTQEGATFVVNGETREYADIWNAKFNPEEVTATDKTDEAKNPFSKAKAADTSEKKNNVREKLTAFQGSVDFDEIIAAAKRFGKMFNILNKKDDKAENKDDEKIKEEEAAALEKKEQEKLEEEQKKKAKETK